MPVPAPSPLETKRALDLRREPGNVRLERPVRCDPRKGGQLAVLAIGAVRTWGSGIALVALVALVPLHPGEVGHPVQFAGPEVAEPERSVLDLARSDASRLDL